MTDLTVTEENRRTSVEGKWNFWKVPKLDTEITEGGHDYVSSFCFKSVPFDATRSWHLQ